MTAKWIEAEDVPGLLRPGMTVFVAGATAEPSAAIEALKAAPEASRGVRYVGVSVPGVNNTDFSSFHEEAAVTAFFSTPATRAAVAAGRIDFLPMQYRVIYDYLADEVPIDLVLTQLPPADADGRISLGISVDFLPAVLDKAGIVVGEFNRRQPSVRGAPALDPVRIDYAFNSDRQLPALPVPKLGEAAATIGKLVADLVRDGDCIQIGIGAIPEAAMAAMGSKNDLGLHSGMVSDGLTKLIDSGTMNGSRKTIDRGKHVCGGSVGSTALHDWAGRAENLLFCPVTHTHDVTVIAQIDNFFSINSALEIDLYGQLNADMLGHEQLSGTGGSVDFMRGAALAQGGKSIVALQATAARCTISRIVPTLKAETAATALRTDIDYVVTEYGARRLKSLSVEDRARALIDLAAPAFRDELRDAWTRLRRR